MAALKEVDVSSPSKALQPVAQRLSILIPRLASNFDAEVVATVGAIRRTLKGANSDFHDLAAVVRACDAPRPQAPPYARRDDPPRNLTHDNWRDVVAWLAARSEIRLSNWEVKFLLSLTKWKGQRLTTKQFCALAQIFETAQQRAAA